MQVNSCTLKNGWSGGSKREPEWVVIWAALDTVLGFMYTPLYPTALNLTYDEIVTCRSKLLLISILQIIYLYTHSENVIAMHN